MDEPVVDHKIQDVVQEPAGPKSPLASKTINFNWLSALIFQAIRPFLPRYVQESPYLYDAVIAWYTLGNIALRFVTKEAISFFWRNEIAFVHRFFFWRKQDADMARKDP